MHNGKICALSAADFLLLIGQPQFGQSQTGSLLFEAWANTTLPIDPYVVDGSDFSFI